MTDPIRLQSEPNPPSGAITAEGLLNTMGRPKKLSATEMLIRESLQNSWDAGGIEGVQPHYAVRLFTPAPEQMEAYRQFFTDRPTGESCPVRRGLDHFFSAESPVLMEISDRGTVGLGGPTRADGDDAGDFANFLRNIGKPRDVEQGGGTYGFGKSSFYLMSGPQLLVVDTLTNFEGREQRRLLAHAAGESFNHEGRHYTGRHWWGVPSTEIPDFVDPALDGDAAAIAQSLGFSTRETGATGTSLMLLDPRLDDLADLMGGPAAGGLTDEVRRRIGFRLQEMLLWWCWPKLVRDVDGRAPMRITIDCFGEDFSPPDPDSVPQLCGFAESLRRTRQQLPEDAVGPQKPMTISGYLFVSERKVGALTPYRQWRSVLGNSALIPDAMAHIALLRPAELVVRYEEGSVAEVDGTEWTGVFRCSDEPEIEQAFALSEPPAHDDWETSQRLSWVQTRIVKAALNRLKDERLDRTRQNRPEQTGSTEGDSVASLSRRIGAALIGLGRGGAGAEPRNPRKPGTRKRKLRLSQPIPCGTRIEDGLVLTSFELTLRGDSASHAKVSIRPTIQADVSSTDESAPNGLKPAVTAIEVAGEAVDVSDSLVIPGSAAGTLIRVDVSMPDYVAIGLDISCEEIPAEVDA